ncbi:unnamed protein product [Caenorhabditis auriculariae]|uniref:Inhibitor of growth protein n=1 Tax=Caenorhabditis auriculariae TaxID=2777116 RepID=A0A8S1HDV4_9PELO|nr:unnamed protein product [Caenorhabditis auriculariae]
MLFLDDFLEMLEELPQELHDRGLDMKQLDAQVELGTKRNREATNDFFANGLSMSEEERAIRYKILQREYARLRELAEEKIALAERMQVNCLQDQLASNAEIINTRIIWKKRRLTFQLEMEADNPGVTETIEKRYAEYVESMLAMRKERKRKHTTNGSADFSEHLNGNADFSKEHADKIHRILNDGSVSKLVKNEFFDDLTSNGTPVPSPAPRGRPPKSSLMLSSALVTPLAEDGPLSTPGRVGHMRRSNAGNLRGSVHIPSVNGGVSSTRMSPAVSEKSWSATSGAVDDSSSFGANFSMGPPSTPNTMPTFVGSESRHGRPRKLTTRVQEMFKEAVQRQRHHHHSSPMLTTPQPATEEDDEEGSSDDEDGEDTRRWCFCSEKSYGDMVACDNKSCPYQWFHYPCVGITAPPRGRWFCPRCQPALDADASAEVSSAL